MIITWEHALNINFEKESYVQGITDGPQRNRLKLKNFESIYIPLSSVL